MTDLQQAKDFIQKIVKWTEGHGSQQATRSTPWRWVVGLLVGAAAALFVGFLYYRAWKKGRELAKLKHEKDVLETKQKMAIINEKMSTNQHEMDLALIDFKHAKLATVKLEEKMRAVEADHKKSMEAVDALKTWDDVDRYTGRHNPPGGS